jgi:hypothetical protein
VFSAVKVAGSKTGCRINDHKSRRTNTRRRLLMWVITGLVWFINLHIWAFASQEINYNIKEILGQIQTANRAHFNILQLIWLHNTTWRVQVMLRRMLVSSSVLYDSEKNSFPESHQHNCYRFRKGYPQKN